MRKTTIFYARCLYEMTREAKKEDLIVLLDSFLCMVRKDRMMSQMKLILSQFREIWNGEHRVVDVFVTSRYPLTQETEKKIKEYVQKKYTDSKVVLYADSKESCIGGVRIFVCGEVIDGTIAKQLFRLQQNFIQ